LNPETEHHILIISGMALAAIIPSMVLLRWFRNSDQFPEPWPIIRKVFWRGIWIVIPVLMIAESLKPWMPVDDALLQALYTAFALAACPEELMKYCVLVFYCLKLKDFDEPMDGIVYGVTVSLGFATLENILYVMSGDMQVAITRALTAVPAHALTGAIMGYFIGSILRTPEKRTRLLILALLIPTLLHGAYDFPLMYLKAAPSKAWVLLLFLLVVITQWKLALRFKKELWKQQKHVQTGA